MIKRNKYSFIALFAALIAIAIIVMGYLADKRITGYRIFLLALDVFVLGWNSSVIVYKELVYR